MNIEKKNNKENFSECINHAVTGMRPTNNLHLGNYLGVFPNLQKYTNSLIFVADLHSLTEGNINKEHSIKLAKYFLILGDKNLIYLQSRIPQIPYLSWILTCRTTTGELERMTQYKSKKNQNNNTGLFFYPMLMAADILGSNADVIPVGIDQKQHIEIARDLAIKFQDKVPDIVITEGAKIYDLQNPEIKMSKTNSANSGIIFLNDSPEQITMKIKKAQTDSLGMPQCLEDLTNRNGLKNLYNIFSIVSGKSMDYLFQNYHNFSSFKGDLAEILVDYCGHIEKMVMEIDHTFVEETLQKNENIVQSIFQKKLDFYKTKIGL